MRLPNGVEQACCIIGLLIHPDSAGQPITNTFIAEKLEVSPSYLAKITRKLVVSGIITSRYGVGGGFSLARNPGEITLYDVVTAIDGDDLFFRSEGLLPKVFSYQIQAAERSLDALENRFTHAQKRWSEELQSMTLSSLLNEISGVEL